MRNIFRIKGCLLLRVCVYALCKSDSGVPVFDALGAVSVSTSIVWAFWLLVEKFAGSANCVMSETHGGAVLGAHDPLPEASTASDTLRHCAGGCCRVASIKAVCSRDVAFNDVFLLVVQSKCRNEKRKELKTERQGIVHPLYLFPLGLGTIFVAEAHMVRDLLRLSRRDTLPVGIGHTLRLSLDNKR